MKSVNSQELDKRLENLIGRKNRARDLAAKYANLAAKAWEAGNKKEAKKLEKLETEAFKEIRMLENKIANYKPDSFNGFSADYIRRECYGDDD